MFPEILSSLLFTFQNCHCITGLPLAAGKLWAFVEEKRRQSSGEWMSSDPISHN
jgi:hypothetical protein